MQETEKNKFILSEEEKKMVEENFIHYKYCPMCGEELHDNKGYFYWNKTYYIKECQRCGYERTAYEEKMPSEDEIKVAIAHEKAILQRNHLIEDSE